MRELDLGTQYIQLKLQILSIYTSNIVGVTEILVGGHRLHSKEMRELVLTGGIHRASSQRARSHMDRQAKAIRRLGVLLRNEKEKLADQSSAGFVFVSAEDGLGEIMNPRPARLGERRLRDRLQLAVVTNDIYTQEDAQFLTRAQVEQLTDVADLLRIPVLCYGLRTDFQAQLFPGSAALLALPLGSWLACDGWHWRFQFPTRPRQRQF